MKPAAAKGLLSRFRVLEIAFENVFATQDDLTKFTLSDFVVIVIDDFHFIPDWQATRAGATLIVRRIESRAAGRFRKTVTFNHGTVESLFELFHDFRRHRRRTAHRKAKLIGFQTLRHAIRIRIEQNRQHRSN